MKKLKILLIVFTLFMLGSKTVYAYDVDYERNYDGNDITWSKTNRYGLEIRKYSVSGVAEGIDFMTFCLDPGLQFGQGQGAYEATIIDLAEVTPGTPEFKWELGIILAYKKLRELDKLKLITDKNYITSAVLMRMITKQYDGKEPKTGSSLMEPFQRYGRYVLYSNKNCSTSTVDSKCNQVNEELGKLESNKYAVIDAINLYQQVYHEVEGITEHKKTLADLIKDGTVYGYTAEFKQDTEAPQYLENGVIKRTGTLVFDQSLSRIKEDMFKVTSKSINITSSKFEKINDKEVKVTYTYTYTGTPSSFDLKFTIKGDFHTEENYMDKLLLLKRKGTGDYQRMLAVIPFSNVEVHKDLEVTVIITTDQTNNCLCYYDEKGDWTGYQFKSSKGLEDYPYRSLKNGGIFVAKNELRPTDKKHFNCKDCQDHASYCQQPEDNPRSWICRDKVHNDGIGELCSSRLNLNREPTDNEIIEVWTDECGNGKNTTAPSCSQPNKNDSTTWYCDDPNTDNSHEKLCVERSEVQNGTYTAETLYNHECKSCINTPADDPTKWICQDGKLCSQQIKDTYSINPTPEEIKDFFNSQASGCGNGTPFTPTPRGPACSVTNNQYYCADGTSCTKEEYEKQCPNTPNKGVICYNDNGNLPKSQWVCQDTDGDNTGEFCKDRSNVTSEPDIEQQFQQECEAKECTKENGNFYCKDGAKCTEEEYHEKCEQPSTNGQTCNKNSIYPKYWICEDLDGDGNGEFCIDRPNVTTDEEIEQQYQQECATKCSKPDEKNKKTWICEDSNGDGNGEKCITRPGVDPNDDISIEDKWEEECEQYITKCTCEASTGIYTATTTDSQGNVIASDSWKSDDPNSGRLAAQYQCTDSCPVPYHDCSIEQDANGNDIYYGPEITPGAGDGKVIDKTEYTASCECPNLELACNNSHDQNSKECQDYENTCNICLPQVTIPSDCYDIQDKDDLYKSDYLSVTISDITKVPNKCTNNKVNTPKACVIGKKDATGESFKDESIDNPYCQVWCEEKYDFDLPTARYTQSGGYFRLDMNVTATRICYVTSADNSNDPINVTDFEKNLETARQNVIDRYNEWAKWYAAANSATYTTDESDDGCSARLIDTRKCDTSSALYDGSEGCSDISLGNCNAKGHTSWNASWSYDAYDYNLNSTSLSASLDSKGSSSSCPANGTVDRKNVGENYDISKACKDGVDGTKSAIEKEISSKLSSAKGQLDSAITAFYNVIKNYNNCSGNVRMGNSNLQNDAWNNEIQFDPKITYTYDEKLYLRNGEGEFTANPTTYTETKESMYCSGDINSEYDTCSNGDASIVNNDELDAVTMIEKRAIPMCLSKNSGGYECKQDYEFLISKAKWVKKKTTVSQNFTANNKFATYVQYGTIKNQNNNDPRLYTNLPSNAYPISLNTKTGVYNFQLKFNNIGQSNKDGSSGRLIGADYVSKNGEDVLTAYNNLAPSLKCSTNNSTAKTDVGYICHYINNCDDCHINCTSQGCTAEDPNTSCSGPGCTYTCANCAFDGNNSNFTYRIVSLNNLFPNQNSNRTIGFNWNNIKGTTTKNEIDQDGEKVYETPQYSYTLSPIQLANIRKYNDDVGIYTNTTVSQNVENKTGESAAVYCDTYTDKITGKTYNINCRSTFLDYLDMDSTFGTVNSRITSSNNSNNAWDIFPESNCPQGYGVGICKGIGPSWKMRIPSSTP